MFSVSTSTSGYVNQPGFSRKVFQELVANESTGLYASWMKAQGFSPTTIKTYSSWVRKFLASCCALNETYSSLSREQQLHQLIVEFKVKLINEEGCSPQSTNNAMSAIDSFCHYLHILPPAIPRELKPDSEYPVLTRSEVGTIIGVLLSYKTSPRDRAIALLFLGVGLSLKNCRGINVEDICLSLDKTRILLEFGVDNRRQSIYIPAESLPGRALLQWRAERLQIGNDPQALFLSSAGQRLSVNSFDALVRKIGWKARIPVSIKLLRDTYAHFKKLGIDLDSCCGG